MLSVKPACLWLLAFAPAFAQGSVADALRFDSSPLMTRTAYADPDRVAVEIASTGAASPVNIRWERTGSGVWFIEEQRHGAEVVVAGIVRHDRSVIDRGLRILQWGYDRQEPDGSFACPDVYHSTSFVVEAAARACLYLEASSYASQYAPQIAQLKPALLRSARWMARPEVERAGRAKDASMTHRDYLDADALGEAGVCCGDAALISRSWSYVESGLRKQSADGINPEARGYDVSYDAVGLGFAGRYYDLVATPEQQATMRPALEKGVAWLRSRVLPNGSFDLSGSTRVGGIRTELTRNGKPKAMDYAAALRALAWWGWTARDPAYTELAEKIFAAQENRAGPKPTWMN